MSKDYPHITHWSILHAETYCTLNWEYGSKSGKWVYVMDDNHDFDNMKKEPNPDYDPNIKPKKFPKGCSKEITIHCLKCKHAAFAEYVGDEEEDGLK